MGVRTASRWAQAWMLAEDLGAEDALWEAMAEHWPYMERWYGPELALQACLDMSAVHIGTDERDALLDVFEGDDGLVYGGGCEGAVRGLLDEVRQLRVG